MVEMSKGPWRVVRPMALVQSDVESRRCRKKKMLLCYGVHWKALSGSHTARENPTIAVPSDVKVTPNGSRARCGIKKVQKRESVCVLWSSSGAWESFIGSYTAPENSTVGVSSDVKVTPSRRYAFGFEKGESLLLKDEGSGVGALTHLGNCCLPR